jgi:hypothetical protein
MEDDAILSGLRIDRIHLNLGIDGTGYQVADSPLEIRRRHRGSLYGSEIMEIESLHIFHPLSCVLISLQGISLSFLGDVSFGNGLLKT